MMKLIRKFLDKIKEPSEFQKRQIGFYPQFVFLNNDTKMVYESEGIQEKSTYSIDSSNIFVFEKNKLHISNLNDKSDIIQMMTLRIKYKYISQIIISLSPLFLICFDRFIVIGGVFIYCSYFFSILHSVDFDYFIKSISLLYDGKTLEIDLCNDEKLIVDINDIRKVSSDHLKIMWMSISCLLFRGIPILINGKAYYIHHKTNIYHKEILSAIINGNYIDIPEKNKIQMENVIKI